MAGPRHDVVPVDLRFLLLLAAQVGCTFNAVGLGQSGETGQSATTEAGSSGPASAGSSTGEATTQPTGEATMTTHGGASGESGTSGAVEPGGSTGVGTTSSASTGEATTTGDTTGGSSSGGGSSGSSSGGCVEQAYFLDDDDDGFGDPEEMMVSCAPPPEGYVSDGGDCDDDDEQVKPGGAEMCDGKDNDCDGLEDEFSPTNADCEGCKMVLHEGRLYHFCTDSQKWPEARVLCMERGADLAIDDDDAEHGWLVSQLPAESGPWYIGASAPGDDMFVWVDGTKVPNPDARWGVGRPFDGNNTNYLALVSSGVNAGPFLLSSGRWHDRGNDMEPFICEGPLP